MTTSTLKKRVLNGRKFEREHKKADDAIIKALIRARTMSKMSQDQVAKRIGTTQSAIARLESGHVAPTLSTLRRYAEATGTRLTVELVNV